jgi:hypothetical protein
MRLVAKIAAAALLVACCASAQVRDQREATVGMRAYVEQVVLEGSELIAAPTTAKAPVIVRVLATWPHGDHLRYDLEWAGFEEGRFDLTDYLVRKDGSSTEGLPEVAVEVTSVLPGDMFEPSELSPERGGSLGGYTRLQLAVGAAWLLGLVAILFVGRKRKPVSAPLAAPPTLADRLRPLVDRVTAGAAAEHEKAELERLLVAFWRARLGLGDKNVADAVMAIRADERAGALLRHVEAWLHAPQPPADVDLGALLAPYRSVTAAQFRSEGR